jgi:hypothetical protein
MQKNSIFSFSFFAWIQNYRRNQTIIGYIRPRRISMQHYFFIYSPMAYTGGYQRNAFEINQDALGFH